jgi:hypothetical protein
MLFLFQALKRNFLVYWEGTLYLEISNLTHASRYKIPRILKKGSVRTKPFFAFF